MEVVRYAEYSSQTESGLVTIQIPDDDTMPVQIIINFGKTFILKFPELQDVCRTVVEALRDAGKSLASDVDEIGKG